VGGVLDLVARYLEDRTERLARVVVGIDDEDALASGHDTA
jgi:hypothetical protein